MIPEFEVIIYKSLWKIYWRLFGIRLFLATERCFLVGWSLAVNFYCGRSHSVAWGRKIYKCNIDGGGFGVCSKENVRNFSCINVVLMEEAWEVSSGENTRSFNYLKGGVPSITIRGDEEMEEGMKNVLCMKRMEWRGRKCELVNHVGEIIAEGRIVAHDPKEPILDEEFGEIKVGDLISNYPKDTL
jgi:hypothetical protein